MSKKRFSIAERMALWHAWGKKCPYTGELLEFQQMEVDHLEGIS